jgi:hypothetical protein
MELFLAVVGFGIALFLIFAGWALMLYAESKSHKHHGLKHTKREDQKLSTWYSSTTVQEPTKEKENENNV